MLTLLNCVIIDPDASNRTALAELITANGGSIVGSEGNLEKLPSLLIAAPPGAAIVALDPKPQDALRQLGPLVQQYPSTAFFVMSKVIDPKMLMEAIRIGVKNFLPLPLDRDSLLGDLARLSSSIQTQRQCARLIQFISMSGGAGSTTMACNVATSLAKKGKTLLIDLDLLRGSVAAAFDVSPRFTISDLMDMSTPLDGHLIDCAIVRHEGTGLSILNRPENPDDSAKVHVQGIKRLLNAAQTMFDYIVMDSMVGGDLLFASVANLSDVIVLAMQLSVPCVRNTQRMMEMLRRQGIGDDKLRVVINRHTRRGNDIDPGEVEQTLGVKIAWVVPNDFRSVITSINYGEPFVLRFPRAEITESVTKLSHMLNGRSNAATLQKA